jgi:hypothetical protein
MLKRNRIFLTYLLAATCFTSACFKGKNVVTKIPSARKNTKLNGVFYALPQTVINIAVPIKRVDAQPGKYQTFARCFLPASDADNRVLVKNTAFSIGNPTFLSRGEPDPTEIYMAKFDSGLFENKTMLLEFTESGVLTKGEAETTNQNLDITIQAVKTAASIASAGITTGVFGGGSLPKSGAEKIFLEEIKKLVEDKEAVAARKCLAVIAEEVADKALKAAKASESPKAETEANEAVKCAGKINNATAKDSTQPANDKCLSVETPDVELPYKMAITALVHAAKASEAAVSAIRSRIKTVPRADPTVDEKLKAAHEKARNSQSLALEVYSNLAITTKQKEAVLGKQPLREVSSNIENFKTLFLEAQAINKRIENLQTQREELISGGRASDGLPPETIKLMLKELDDTLASYKNKYFLGTNEETSWSGAFDYTPPASKRFFAGQRITLAEVAAHLARLGFVENKGGSTRGTFTTDDSSLSVRPSAAEFQQVKISFGNRRNQIASIELSGNNSSGSLEDIDLKPEMLGPMSLPLFVFSTKYGVCKLIADDQGVKLSPKFSIKKECPDGDDKCDEEKMTPVKCEAEDAATVALNLKMGKSGKNEFQLADQIKAQRFNETGERGFYYRIPAMTLASLMIGKTEKSRAAFAVAQLGLTASLPASTGGRKTTYKMALYDGSGALKNFNLGSEAAIQKSNLEDLGTAATTLINSKDELKQLERRQQILTKLKEIRDLEEELGTEEPATPTPDPE